ncbi:uncharacterized protein LOC141725428 isoform X1 [Zonotrichia albicollis]|uniref:uncharacterized protein LOC141725428 isoform X1 n=1 Tax=Zonotrichia albicollis TaxID=44394 RepID=UPI003D80E617
MSGRGGHGGHRTPREAEITAAPPAPRRRQPRDAAGGTGGMRGRAELPPGPDPAPSIPRSLGTIPNPGDRGRSSPGAAAGRDFLPRNSRNSRNSRFPGKGSTCQGRMGERAQTAAKGRRRERPEPGRAARSPRLGWRCRGHRSDLGTFGDIWGHSGAAHGPCPAAGAPFADANGERWKISAQRRLCVPGVCEHPSSTFPSGSAAESGALGAPRALRRGPVSNLGGFWGAQSVEAARVMEQEDSLGSGSFWGDLGDFWLRIPSVEGLVCGAAQGRGFGVPRASGDAPGAGGSDI